MKDKDSATPGYFPRGLVIAVLRFTAGLILLVFWPVLTFILPFTLDDPTPQGALGRVMFIGLYAVYPLTFYFSGESYKAYLREGNKTRAVVIASAPFFVLLTFFSLVFGLSSR